jgi:hypothetical protein
VLVATALSILLLAAVALAMASLADAATRSRDRLAILGDAARVLDQLTLDLQSALSAPRKGAVLRATIQPEGSASGEWIDGGKPAAASLRLGGPAVSDDRFGRCGLWLRFFASRRVTDPRTGDPAMPAAVAYQVIRRPIASGGAPQYLLFRSEVSGRATFETGRDLNAAAYDTAESGDGAAGNIRTPTGQRVLAQGVVDFGVRFYALPTIGAASARAAVIFPASAGSLEFAVEDGAPLPAFADVMVRILTATGARRLAAVEAGKVAGDWWTIVEANSVVVTRRIAIPASRGLPLS